MTTVILKGGLGNQLFQYALGRSIQVNNPSTLFLDISGLSKYKSNITFRNFELDFFKYRGKVENSKYLGFLKFITCKKWFASLFRLPYYHKEISDTFDENFINLPKDTIFDGYWQSYKYFENISNILMSDFDSHNTLSSESALILKKVNSSKVSVAIHVRRGDYLTNSAANKFHGVLSYDYYCESIDRVMLNLNNPHFFVFSDDPEWCKSNIKFNSSKATFISHNSGVDGWQDLILMSHCRHHIIANSSFSWWGAWMADQRFGAARTVISPKRWFFDAAINIADRFPSHWILA